jgi:hypothetical protein
MSLRALASVCLLLPLCGCFVFDEIDKSQKMMGKAPAAEPKPAARASQPEKEKPANWWEKASSLTPGEGDASIVRCRIRGKLEYMREPDCLTRGGHPARG